MSSSAARTATAAATGQRLVAENLSKRYKGRAVVQDVSLSLAQGEVVGLLGPNGAGKTTSFYMIVGLVTPDSGRITLGERNLVGLPMHTRAQLGIGYLPQEASVFRKLSVSDNIRAILQVRPGLTKADIDRELAALLDELSIGHIADSKGINLSGGERRRVEIARALAAEPQFMLLDEPFAGIDPLAIAEIRELVAHLKDRGLGVLITDHNVRETLDIIDRAYIIHEGEVLLEGAPGEIVGDKDVRRVYLGDRFQM